MSRNPDQLDLDFGVAALDDYDADGVAQVQTDTPALDDDEGTQPAERLMPFGFFSRLRDPEKGAGTSNSVGLGATVLEIRYGDRRYVLPLGDPRDVGKLPKLKKGGAMMGGGAGDYRSFVMVDGEDPKGVQPAGSILISASYASGGAKKSLGISMNLRTPGKEEITLVHGDGARVTIDKNGTTVAAPNGKHYFNVGSKGNVLAGDTKVVGSLQVGQSKGADAVVLASPLTALLEQLISIVAAINATTTGAPAAALTTQLALLKAKHLQTT